MESLAEGGFQVGELAKFLVSDEPYFDNISVDSLDYEESLRITKEKLKNKYVSIAEPAFLFKNLFIKLICFKKR